MSTFLSAKLFLVIIVIHWGKNFADSLRNLLYIFSKCINSLIMLQVPVYYFGFTIEYMYFLKKLSLFLG